MRNVQTCHQFSVVRETNCQYRLLINVSIEVSNVGSGPAGHTRVGKRRACCCRLKRVTEGNSYCWHNNVNATHAPNSTVIFAFYSIRLPNRFVVKKSEFRFCVDVLLCNDSRSCYRRRHYEHVYSHEAENKKNT